MLEQKNTLIQNNKKKVIIKETTTAITAIQKSYADTKQYNDK